MVASAGGYYKLQDYRKQYNSTSYFPRTQSKKRVCFIYDETKPAHCTQTGGRCSSEPLTLSTRLTRHPEVRVDVDGWTDPRPRGAEGNSKSASGIDRFRLEVHGVDVGRMALAVQVSPQESFFLFFRGMTIAPVPFPVLSCTGLFAICHWGDGVAQLVERRSQYSKDRGSNPARSTRKYCQLKMLC